MCAILVSSVLLAFEGPDASLPSLPSCAAELNRTQCSSILDARDWCVHRRRFRTGLATCFFRSVSSRGPFIRTRISTCLYHHRCRRRHGPTSLVMLEGRDGQSLVIGGSSLVILRRKERVIPCNPSLCRYGPTDLLKVVDNIFYGVFLAEFLIKIVAFGFLTTKNAYISDSWNRLDFVVVSDLPCNC